MPLRSTDISRDQRLRSISRKTVRDAMPLAGVLLVITLGSCLVALKIHHTSEILAKDAIPGVDRINHVEATVRNLSKHLHELTIVEPEHRPELLAEVNLTSTDCTTWLANTRRRSPPPKISR